MKKLAMVVGLALVLLLLINTPFYKKFTITNGKTNHIVFIGDLDSVKEFHITYQHSVNRTPVNDYYRIENEGFTVYKTTFYSYGAGMPEYVPGSGEKVSVFDGLIQVENIDRVLKGFTVFTGTYSNHQLVYKDDCIELSSVVEPQTPLVFEIRRVSLLTLLRHQAFIK